MSKIIHKLIGYKVGVINPYATIIFKLNDSLPLSMNSYLMLKK